jgi:hypothetical protein
MTFETEEIREQFHNLPTEVQVNYIELEQTLFELERQLHIVEGKDGELSEVIVRISN